MGVCVCTAACGKMLWLAVPNSVKDNETRVQLYNRYDTFHQFPVYESFPFLSDASHGLHELLVVPVPIRLHLLNMFLGVPGLAKRCSSVARVKYGMDHQDLGKDSKTSLFQLQSKWNTFSKLRSQNLCSMQAHILGLPLLSASTQGRLQNIYWSKLGLSGVLITSISVHCQLQ